MDFKDAVFKSKRALIVCGKVLVSAGLCLLKLPFQLISAKRPDIFIDSIEGHRYPVYLSSHSLQNSCSKFGCGTSCFSIATFPSGISYLGPSCFCREKIRLLLSS